MLRMHRRWPQAGVRFATVALAAAAIAGLSGACHDDSSPPPDTGDSGSTTGAVGDGICPSFAPAPGDACLLPSGTTCAFGSCGTSIGQCLHGAWLYGENLGPTPVCDPSPPAEGTACPPCWPPAVVCRYGSLNDCTAPDASANITVAICPFGLWRLQYSPCGSLDAGPDVEPPNSADGGPAAPDGEAGDAGADVQGDAEPDGD
jgi:hypothetical protein